jgi:hypothetical protein
LTTHRRLHLHHLHQSARAPLSAIFTETSLELTMRRVSGFDIICLTIGFAIICLICGPIAESCGLAEMIWKL